MEMILTLASFILSFACGIAAGKIIEIKRSLK
jgi:hypothetical protein